MLAQVYNCNHVSIDGLDSSLGMLAQVYNCIHDSIDGLDSSLGILAQVSNCIHDSIDARNWVAHARAASEALTL